MLKILLEVAIFCSKFSCKIHVLIVLLEYNDLILAQDNYHVLNALLECIIQFLYKTLFTDCSIRVHRFLEFV